MQAGSAVVGRLGDHVREVDALPEHVPSLQSPSPLNTVTLSSYRIQPHTQSHSSLIYSNPLTAGASGGAILSPCERIPTKFVTPDPCLSIIHLP